MNFDENISNERNFVEKVKFVPTKLSAADHTKSMQRQGAPTKMVPYVKLHNLHIHEYQ